MVQFYPYSVTFTAKYSIMALNRSIENYLNHWKLSATRKPLIIRGARQIGKTKLIRDFAKTYGHTIVLNLEKPADRRLLHW